MDPVSIIEAHYDTVAAKYDGVNQMVDRLLARLKDVPAGSAILDLGCGTGNLTLRLPELAVWSRVVGVDVSNGVLAIARQHAQDAHLDNFEFRRADATALPFGDNEFDAVVSNLVFHLVSDKAACLREIVRVLRPGGRAVLQCIGGGPTGPEVLAIMQAAWRESFPSDAPENLMQRFLADNAPTVGQMEEYLSAVGVGAFEITWRRSPMRVREPHVGNLLSFLDLVGGFWRHGLQKEKADRIWARVSEEVARSARSAGCFEHTGNHLLVEFAKPATAGEGGR